MKTFLPLVFLVYFGIDLAAGLLNLRGWFRRSRWFGILGVFVLAVIAAVEVGCVYAIYRINTDDE